MQAFGLLRKGRTNRKPLFGFYKIFRNLKSENALPRHPHLFKISTAQGPLKKGKSCVLHKAAQEQGVGDGIDFFFKKKVQMADQCKKIIHVLCSQW